MRTCVIALFCLLALFVAPLPANSVLPASQDVNIANGDFASTNLSVLPYIMISWDCADPCTISQGLVQWDLSPLAGKMIMSAVLSVWHEANEGPGKIFDLYRNTSAWDENFVAYDTRPSVDPTPVATLTIAPDDTLVGLYRAWNVTALVAGWVSGAYGNFGVTVIERNEIEGAEVYFSSLESTEGLPPLLETIDADVPEPSTLALLGGAFVLLGLARVTRRRLA
jgi:hypothetical protein